MNETRDTYELNLGQLLKAMLKKWWMLLILALLCALLMSMYASRIEPVYKTSKWIYVRMSDQASTNAAGLSTASEVVKDYMSLLQSPMVAKAIKAQTPSIEYSSSQIRNMISARNEEGRFIVVTVTASTRADAALIMNTLLSVFPECGETYKMPAVLGIDMDSQVNLTAGSGDVVAEAPSVTTYAVIGCLIGLVIGAVIVVMIELFNDKIQSEEWLKQTFGEAIPLLAVIPSADRADYKRDKYENYNSYTHSYSSYGYRASK